MKNQINIKLKLIFLFLSIPHTSFGQETIKLSFSEISAIKKSSRPKYENKYLFIGKTNATPPAVGTGIKCW